MSRKLLTAILLIASTSISPANPPDGKAAAESLTGYDKFPVAALMEIRRKLPHLTDEVEYSAGDINNDGVADIAAIIHYSGAKGEVERIVILVGESNGEFQLQAQSDEFEPDVHRNEYIAIDRSLIVVTASSTTYTEYSGTEYKFKCYPSGIFLVGLEFSEGAIGEDSSHQISANFLTNRAIERSPGKRKQQEVSKNLHGRYKVPIEKFRLDDPMWLTIQ